MQSLAELNDYFAELSWDSAYKQPTPAQVESGVQVPEISERQVWNCLQHLKKTATGPDLIPFWVWRDHAEIFTPLIGKIWNLSLRFSTWPSSWKRAHVTPLPKADVPKGKKDYRGINITPVIARAFEKSCKTFTRGTLLSNIWTQLSLPTGQGRAVLMRSSVYSIPSIVI